MSSLRLLYLGSELFLSKLSASMFVTPMNSAEAILNQLQETPHLIVLVDDQHPQASLLYEAKHLSLFVLASPPYAEALYQRFANREILDLVDPAQLPLSLDKALILCQDHLPRLPRQEGPPEFSLSQLMSLKNEALAQLYHQLQGPVTALEGYLEILQSDAESLKPASVKQILGQLQQCVLRLRHYFQALHLLSLVSEKPYELKSRAFPFHQLIRDFKRDLEQMTTLNGFAWDCQFDAQEDLVFADPHYILNLLSVLFELAQRTASGNASHLSLQTSSLAMARLESRSQMQLESSQFQTSYLPGTGSGQYLQITFQFRGLGPQLCEALLYVFGAPGALEPVDPEILLGTYFVHKVLYAHQSWLYIENQPGFGMLFSFVLPLQV
jgi:signal transduction histidine kinase